MVLNSMSGSVIFSAIDLTDGFYQILMRPSDIPLTAVSTPSGMLWEWLVMPQGLKNALEATATAVSHNTINLARDQSRAEHHDQQEVQPESYPGIRLHIHEQYRTQGYQTLAEPPMIATQIILHALTLVQRDEDASYAPRLSRYPPRW